MCLQETSSLVTDKLTARLDVAANHPPRLDDAGSGDGDGDGSSLLAEIQRSSRSRSLITHCQFDLLCNLSLDVVCVQGAPKKLTPKKNCIYFSKTKAVYMWRHWCHYKGERHRFGD